MHKPLHIRRFKRWIWVQRAGSCADSCAAWSKFATRIPANANGQNQQREPLLVEGQSVGSQSGPGEKGDERQFVKDALVREIAGLTDQDRLHSAAQVKICHIATPA